MSILLGFLLQIRKSIAGARTANRCFYPMHILIAKCQAIIGNSGSSVVRKAVYENTTGRVHMVRGYEKALLDTRHSGLCVLERERDIGSDEL